MSFQNFGNELRADISRPRTFTADAPFERVGSADIEKVVRECEPMFSAIDVVLREYFPEQSENFQRPTVQRYYRTYKAALNHFHPDQKKKKVEDHFVRDAFVAGVAIRYIDDFIDDALWPHIPQNASVDFLEYFKQFLDRVYRSASVFVPDLFHSIDPVIKLQSLEMELTLFRDQKTFDEKATQLFAYKSKDLAYFHRKIHGLDIAVEDTERFQRSSIRDLLRDFEEEDYSTSTDFNLYNHMKEHKINPEKFIRYLKRVFKEHAPNSYRAYTKGDPSQFFKNENVSPVAELEMQRDDFVSKMVNALYVLKNLQKSL